MRAVTFILFVVVPVCQLAFASESLQSLIDMIEARLKNPGEFAEELRDSEFAALAPELDFGSSARAQSTVVAASAAKPNPLVFMHGMGDSCFNRGMKNIADESGRYLGVYSVCIPTGSSKIKDTLNGFILDMDSSVDVMAKAIKADENLRDNFSCVGLSQGNNLCRGYIQKYNGVDGYPTAHTHISIHGPIVGVASLPNCLPDASKLCREVSEVLGKLAYNKAVQGFLFQADYFRQPDMLNSDKYKQNAQMAKWNNEGITVDASINANFAKTQRFAMIKALGDTVVVPREAEWFGAYDENFNLLEMKQTAWYKEDTFGLRSADEAGKLAFNTTDGNHLEFTTEQLYGWLDLYAI